MDEDVEDADHRERAFELLARILERMWRIPWKKGLMWLALGALIFFLREFFTLIILTFVLSYIGNTVVQRLMAYTNHRKSVTILVFGLLLIALGGTGWFAMPRVVAQGEKLVKKARAVLPNLPDEASDPLLGPEPETGDEEKTDGEEGTDSQDGGAMGPRAKSDLLDKLINQTFGERHHDDVRALIDAPGVREHLEESVLGAAQFVAKSFGTLLAGLWFAVLNFVLAIVLSFIIVWDIPKIRSALQGLKETRIGDFYDEVAPGILAFGGLLGRTLQAQTIIALVNTALTAVGMALLGIQGTGFLSLIVFVCSFVPILGFIASTIPIALVALDQGGITLVFWVLVMVSVVHAVEGYVLNPQIYGASMKLHPLAVLIVLITFKQFFGIWGLILGVPIAVYVYQYLILGADWHDAMEPEPEPET